MKKIIFKAPVTTASGYGVHSRQILKSLLMNSEFDVYIKCLNWGNTSFLNEDNEFLNKIKELSNKFIADPNQNFDVSVQVTIPNEFERMAKFNIGVTAGIECDIVSHEWLLKINKNVDLVVVPSKHSLDSLRGAQYQGNDGSVLTLQRPIALIPECFDQSVFNTNPIDEKDEFDFSTDFNFLFVGLGVSDRIGEERKNISTLIKWFCEEFKDNRNVGLVLKTAVVNNSLMDFNKTKSIIKSIKQKFGFGEYPKIHLVHGRLSDKQLANLYKSKKIKSFISLTHGEGFGLPLLEAAACGLPVMATNWSGHIDFLQIPGQKSFIDLEYDLTEVPQSSVWPGVIEQGAKWASPKESDVKLKMRKVVASYDKPKQWAENLSQHVYQNFSEEKLLPLTSNLFVDATKQFFQQVPQNQQDLVQNVKGQFSEEDSGKKLLYTMPMSAGDVYLSTAIVDSLKKKFPNHKIFFATKKQYTSIVKDNPNIHKVIEWNEWMMNIPLCEQIFDEVYTPNIGIQLMTSNWVHKGNGRNLIEEMANHCLVDIGVPHIELTEVEGLPENYIVFHPGSGKNEHSARNYLEWQEVINNLNERYNGQFSIVQVGTEDEPEYKNVIDYRGKTKDYRELAYVVSKAKLHLGIDSVAMHLAAGLGVDHIALFGSSYASSTGPKQLRKSKLSVLLETPDRYSCDKACYKTSCSVNKEAPCINEISPEKVFQSVCESLGYDTSDGFVYKKHNPKLSGYTHVFNAETGGYPYIESIKSMLGFCDEVIVVDGGSKDGTVEKIKAIGDDRVQVIERQWDWEEPGMDGMQKAFGRAMCSGEFLWQQDSDEIVHEKDYDKIRKLVKTFPKDVNLLHLPVVEFWGDDKTVRTDRHSWKWRLSRNDFSITHGIVKHARLMDEKTGKVYSKKGMSDGCEYVNIMTQEYIPHHGFYSQELENLRVRNPQEYGKRMNKLFSELPSVYHYSWCGLERKIKNFKQTWNRMWSNLYQDPEPVDRFPQIKDENDSEAIKLEAQRLREQGGEHQKSQTFQLDNLSPSIMTEWISKNV